jgi:type II secretory pathway component PulF
MIFSYVGYDKTGQKQKSQLTANNIEDAKDTLKNKGILVENIKEKKSWYTPKMKDAELALMCRNLSIYLKSSV